MNAGFAPVPCRFYDRSWYIHSGQIFLRENSESAKAIWERISLKATDCHEVLRIRSETRREAIIHILKSSYIQICLISSAYSGISGRFQT
jgi:hypothetical protein